MRFLRLIGCFVRASAQQDLMYRSNFWLSLFHSLLNLGVGVAGMRVLFLQVSQIQGWTYEAALGVFGVYLVVTALRGLFIGPGMEALAGLGQEIWNGNFDFALLRPVNAQFLVTFRQWRLFSLVDLAFGVAVLVAAALRSDQALTLAQMGGFFLGLAAGVIVLYSLQLAFAAVSFWNPALLFTWVLDAIFQLARYPVGLYPGIVRFLLTWIIPVGVITTFPAQALNGQQTLPALLGSLALAGLLFTGSTWLFSQGLRRYASASS
ncbi:MAG: ABC-2 family transporter protein [Anaerolineae bacterium]|nr:ABC-2 family transporter protein [Anaerolineae bacterium]